MVHRVCCVALIALAAGVTGCGDRSDTVGDSESARPAVAEAPGVVAPVPAPPSPAGTPTFDVVVTRHFDAPVERVWRVWRAWSEAEEVMKWWAPSGFTSPMCKLDFRVGGTTLVCMRAPKEFGGQDMYNTWTYREIVPHRRIEFVARFSDKDGKRIDPASIGLPATMPSDTRQVVTFESKGANQTEMTVTEYGYPSQELVDLSKQGLGQCLDKMQASFATP